MRWNDAPIGHFLTTYNKALAFEYTIDISPSPANEFGLKSVLFKKDTIPGYDFFISATFILDEKNAKYC